MIELYVVEFIIDSHDTKPPAKKGERALLNGWRLDRLLKEGKICLLWQHKERRPPFTEAGELKIIEKAEKTIANAKKNVELLHQE